MIERNWQELCEAIMKEQDPQALLTLVDELNRVLDRRERQLKHDHPGHLTPE
jgi:hypothetical protein